MKAILLAAGRGTRISDDIGGLPKSLLEIGGQPLIRHTVELLERNNMEVTVITGYKHKMIEAVLKEYRVKIYYNPFFEVTNSIGSLWCAREELTGDEVFIANADVYYTQELLDIALNTEYDNCLLADETRADFGDYFFLSEGGLLLKYGKGLKREERNCEYVGVGILRDSWVKRFRDRLCSLIEEGSCNLWWENVLYSFVGEEPVHTADVKGCFWSEVDTAEDYRRVLEHVKN